MHGERLEFDARLQRPAGQSMHGCRRVIDRSPRRGDPRCGHRRRTAARRSTAASAGRHRVGKQETDDGAARAIDEFLGCPFGDQTTGGEHADPIGQLLGFVEVVRGQQHGRAVVTERLDEVPRATTRRRIEAGGRLVEEQHVRPPEDPEREIDPAALPARQRADPGIDLLVESDERDDLVERPW